jgi:outer membrane protein assembly factor BamB
MKSSFFVTTACALTLGLNAAQADWPQWRGPEGNGVAAGATPPTTWDESSNVKWKASLPGFGTSTPVVWKGKIFVTTAIPTGKTADGQPVAEKKPEEAAPPPPPPGERRRGEGGPGGPGGRPRGETPTEVHQFVVLCLDLGTGKTIWQKVAKELVPHEGHHRDHGFASHSAVTDGEMVYAYFGSRGLHAFSMDGEPRWSKDLGQMQTRAGFGEGSSPLLYGDSIVINWDHEGADFVAVFDKKTGDERWRKERDEPTNWSTPVGLTHDGVAQVVISATNRIRSYALATGEVLWECGGMTTNVIPTPIVDGDMVFAISGFRGNALRAIRLGRTGDLTDTDAIAWSYDAKCPYVPSALLSDGRLWFFSQNTGLISCLDAKTGKVLIDAERVEGLTGVYASPIAADGRIYLLGRNGEAVVIKDAATFEVLATNKLDDKFDASPVAVGSSLLLRGHQHLYCVAGK